MRDWLGNPELLRDPHWDTLLGRMSIQEDILDPLYEDLFSTMGMSELSAEAQRRGIVMTPVMRPRAVLEAEHYRVRRSFVDVELDGGATGAMASGMLELDGKRVGYRTAAPKIGQDDGEVDSLWTERNRAAAAGAGAPSRLPLAGLRVVDFGHGGVGVEAASMLAQYGAEVIKIESRTYPDFIRLVAGSEMSPSFASTSRSKQSLGINVKTPEGLELITVLIRQSDVVIEKQFDWHHGGARTWLRGAESDKSPDRDGQQPAHGLDGAMVHLARVRTEYSPSRRHDLALELP
jgi:crotonobetainyl-CoA:carnitine CoA-transferase CaiB-like acyl-CoA transferase